MPVEPSSLAYSIGALTADATNKSVSFEDALSRALQAAVVLLAADGAGLMLVDSTGERLVGARGTDERSQLAERVQEQLGQGPCLQAFASRRPVAIWDVGADRRWTPVPAALLEAGVRAVLAVPVELAGGPVGVLDLYRARPHLWDDSEMTAVQAFAGVLGNLLNALAAVQASGRLAEQLQYALEHRVRVEQAKGVLMSRHGLDEATAFARLRRTARSSRQTVDAVAREVVASALVDGRGKASEEPV
jgi:GAF domain-containing protein